VIDRSSGEYVQSLVRGLAVIRAFDADNAVLTLSDVARRTDMPRAAARRFLNTLESLGYVRTRAEGRAFELTPRVLELGFSYLSSLSLPEIVQPHLERLSHEVGESASAAVLDGADIVYIARVSTRQIMNVRITIGRRFPAYATALGRVLLADLEHAELQGMLDAAIPERLTPSTLTDAAALTAEIAGVRAKGWAVVDGELEPGLRSIAAPIHAQDGRVVAAVNVSTSATRDEMDRLRDDYLPALLRATQDIDSELRLI